MSTQGGYVCAIIADSLMWWLFGKRYPLHMRVYVYRTREITNAEKMADYRAVVSMGTL